MKKPKRVRRKARFRGGEVVFHEANEGFYKIARVEFPYGRPIYYFHNRIWGEPERGLRPLTAKEIGPCRYCQERGR